MKLTTIGFTKTSASDFFRRLKFAGVRHVWDTRLNRVSQLSGFAKERDLKFFLREITSCSYVVQEELAPNQNILKAYQDKEISWKEYEKLYLDLLSSRKVEKIYKDRDLEGVCLLCSEATPEHCHRRLAADYLQMAIHDVQIEHL